MNSADASFSCVVTSNEWLVTDRETTVELNVFGKCFVFVIQSVTMIFCTPRIALYAVVSTFNAQISFLQR